MEEIFKVKVKDLLLDYLMDENEKYKSYRLRPYTNVFRIETIADNVPADTIKYVYGNILLDHTKMNLGGQVLSDIGIDRFALPDDLEIENRQAKVSFKRDDNVVAVEFSFE